MDNCFSPSNSHLKKELIALSRSNLLRDPETRPSWKSPLSSKSTANATNFSSHAHEWKSNTKSPCKSGAILDFDSKPGARTGCRRKKTYLYNWGRQSSKSSGSGIRLDEDNSKESVQNTTEDDILNNHTKAMKNPAVRRKSRKMRMNATPKWPVARNLVKTVLLDQPPCTLDLSDDNGYYNSEDLQHKMQEFIQGIGHASHEGMSFLSASTFGNWFGPHEFLKNSGIEESSCTSSPASSTCKRYRNEKLNGIGSWNGRQGCGSFCNSSKTIKRMGCKGWYSPSFSDKLRIKGSSFLCGSQTQNHKRRKSKVLRKNMSTSIHVLPLLSTSYDGGSSSTESASIETSAKFGELEMEALNRLDKKGWLKCGNQEGAEVVSRVRSNRDIYKNRSLDWKYRPRFFNEIIGQRIIVQSLNNAVMRGRIAPAYLFQGPRGTGKTSCARIFAAALNCSSIAEKKPCGLCRECSEFSSGLGSSLKELDATDDRSVEWISYFLKTLFSASKSTGYNVIVVDQCHMISSKIWSAFVKFLEEPPSHIVLIFITVDPNNLPEAVVSRCRKYVFSKIRDVDLVSRLRKLTSEERLDVEDEALRSIAVKSDGSMREAVIMLEQLSLLGKRITASLINDLVGIVSDEKLLDLLETAMSSDTAETMKISRELLSSGIDPMTLMAQLARLIMDIIAGTNQLSSSASDNSIVKGQRLSESELDRLHQALKVLSHSEKRHSGECSTWLIAALLNLGSGNSSSPLSSRSDSSKTVKKISKSCTSNLVEPLENDKDKASLSLQHASPDMTLSATQLTTEKMDSSPAILFPSSCHGDPDHKAPFQCFSPEKLNSIWSSCIEGCHSKSLRNLLVNDGKLESISNAGGELIACITFGTASNKCRAERFLSSIRSSLERVLRYKVKVNIYVFTDEILNGVGRRLDSSTQNEPIDKERKVETGNTNCCPNQFLQNASPNQPRRSIECYEDKLLRTAYVHENSHELNESCGDEIIPVFSSTPMRDQASSEAEHTIARKTLENAWLQAVERGRATNQTPPRNGFSYESGSKHENMAFAISSKHWEDELNYEIKTLKAEAFKKDQNNERINSHPLSPSTLHTNKWPDNITEGNEGYDSGPGCKGLLCWKAKRSHQEKGKQGIIARPRKLNRTSWLCNGRSKAAKSRFST